MSTWQSINPFLNRTTLVASAGCNFFLNGCNITVEYWLQQGSNGGSGGGSNWYQYPALSNVDVNFNTLANVGTLFVDNIYSSGDPINVYKSLLLFGGIDLQLRDIVNVSNIDLQTINGLPYSGSSGSPSNWFAYPALSNVYINFKNITDVDTLFLDTLDSSLGNPINVNQQLVCYNGLDAQSHNIENVANISLTSINGTPYSLPTYSNLPSVDTSNLRVNSISVKNTSNSNVVFNSSVTMSTGKNINLNNNAILNGATVYTNYLNTNNIASVSGSTINFSGILDLNGGIIYNANILRLIGTGAAQATLQFFDTDYATIGELRADGANLVLDVSPNYFTINSDLNLNQTNINNVNTIHTNAFYFSIPDTTDFINFRFYSGNICYSLDDIVYTPLASDWYRFSASGDVDMGGCAITNASKIVTGDTQQPCIQFGTVNIDVGGYSDVTLPNSYPSTYIVQVTAM